MQCANRDGELVARKATGKNGSDVDFFECESCGSIWIDSFSANYINVEELLTRSNKVHTNPVDSHPHCPECGESLEIVRSEVTPAHLTVFKCKNDHGYFFPTGVLQEFRQAQEAKINYFKLWRLPLPPLKQVLLAAMVISLLSTGLIGSYMAVQRYQSIQIMGEEIIVSQRAYVTTESNSAVVVVQTSIPTQMTLVVPTNSDFTGQMETTDQTHHTRALHNVLPGTYEYYFTYEIEGKTQQSKTYEFVME